MRTRRYFIRAIAMGVIGSAFYAAPVVPIVDRIAPGEVSSASATPFSDYESLVIGGGGGGYWRLQDPPGVGVDNVIAGPPNGVQAGANEQVPGPADGWYAMEFNGSSSGTCSGVDVTGSGGWQNQLAYATNLNVEAWVQTTHPGMVFRWRWYGYNLRIGASGQLTFNGYFDATTQWSLSSPPLPELLDGQWHHVAATRDGISDDFTIYLDGKVVATANIPGGAMYYQSPNVAIGRDGSACPSLLSTHSPFNGRMAEVRVSGTTVLSESDFRARVALINQVRVLDEESIAAATPGAADPVNAANGNFVHQTEDLSAPPNAPGLEWGRSYNASNTVAGALGQGWTGWFDLTATIDPSGDVLVHRADGLTSTFDTDGQVSPEGWDGAVLTDPPGGPMELTFTDGTVWEFSASGSTRFVTEIRRWDGHTLTITRNGQSDPIDVVSSNGPSLEFTYGGSDELLEVEASDGRVVEYTYDVNGDLDTVTDAAGGVWDLDMDAGRLLERITDPEGVQQLENSYDVDGRVTSQENVSGNVITFSYDLVNRQTTVTDTGASEAIIYQFDHTWRLEKLIDPLTKEATRAFDSKGNLLEAIDRNGATVERTYDQFNNVTSVQRDGFGTVDLVYDVASRMTDHTVPGQGTTTLTYDGTERIPDSVTNALNETIQQDVVGGLVTSTTDPDGVVTEYGYDADDRLETVTLAGAAGAGDDLTTTRTYDAAGRVGSITTAEGNITAWTYDDQGRVLTETAADGGVTTTTYNAAGQVETVTDPLGKVTTNTYDLSGRLETVTDPDSNTTTYTYDALGRVDTVTRPGSAVETTVYGELSRVDKVIDPENRETAFEYDDDGNVVSELAADGGETLFEYDAEGRLWKETDPTGFETITTYDTAGRVETVTAAGRETSYAYDVLGRQSTVTAPDGGVTETVYTPGGRVDEVIQPNTGVVDYVYDDYGRLGSVIDATGRETTIGYDLDSRRTLVTSEGGLVTTTTYDEVGRVLTMTDPAGVTTTKTYDLRGQVLSEQITGQNAVNYTYFDNGTLESVTDARGNTTTFTYDGRGNRLTRTNDLSDTEYWVYNLADEMTAHEDLLGLVTDYTYDPVGRIDTIAEPNAPITDYTYDLAGRVTSRSHTQGIDVLTYDFTYHPNGDLWFATDGAETWYWGFDDAGRVNLHSRPGIDTWWAHDQMGSPTFVRRSDGSETVTSYDLAGRPETITPVYTLADEFNAPYPVPPDSGKWTTNLTAGGTAATGGYWLDLTTTSTAGSSAGISAVVDDTTDSETVFSYTFSDPFTTGGELRAAVRVDGGAGDEYRVAIPTDSTTGELQKVVGGVPSTINTFTVPNTVDPVSVRMRVEGDDLKVRVWPSFDPEPGVWDLEEADVDVSAAGGLTIGYEQVSGGPTSAALHWVYYSDLAAPPAPVVSWTYDLDGFIDTETMRDGDRDWTRTDGQITGLDQTLPAATAVSTLTYTSSGQIDTWTDPGGTTDYDYDTAGQLTTVTPPSGPVTTYTYDDLGRRDTEAIGLATTTYTYNDTGQVLTAGPVTYTYDGAGNRVTAFDGTDTTTYGYDLAGRLANIDRTGPVPSFQTWTYDPGDRLAATDDGVAISQYTWDITRPIPDLLQVQTAGETLSIHSHPSLLTGQQAGADVTSIALDPLGSAVTSTATLALDTGYSAYGAAGVGPDTQPHLGYRSELTINGLTHLRARNYDPGIGQFTSVDPLDGVTGTPVISWAYSYADNDPLNKMDPLGLIACDKQFRTDWDVSVHGQFEFVTCEALPAVLSASCKMTGGDVYAFEPILDDGKEYYGCLGVGCEDGKWKGVACAADRHKDLIIGIATSVLELFPGFDCAKTILSSDRSLTSAGFCALDLVPVVGKADDLLIGGKRFQDLIKAANKAPVNKLDEVATICKRASFGADVPVLMANGTTKAIADIEVGDQVLATDPETGETGPREVAATLPHIDQLLTLKTSAGEIVTTEDHPYWNQTDHEWQESQHLDAGDQILTADGDQVTVEGLDWTTVHTGDAYDLTIDDLHTYYVGAGNESVLVHNAPWCGNLPRLDGSGKVHWYERNIPDYVPENWTRADMTQIADDLRISIATRKAMNAQRGIDYGHAKMLADEERLLRQLEKKLSGS